jgi:putative serine protease PepD
LRFPFPYRAAAVIVMAVAVSALVWRGDVETQTSTAEQRQTIAELNARVASLERNQAKQADWPSIAAAVEPGVVTIEAGDSTGSGWVAHSGAAGSDIVTNFHVVADSFMGGDAAVRVRRNDSTIAGTVTQVDVADDLAVVHVGVRLAALASARGRPILGATVMAIGSPLGLDGTVTLGVVSGFRSLEGSDYIQFSAPISPGNSGGPVIDSRGRVVAVASAKLVGTGVEALSLAIPVQTVCLSLVVCTFGAA